ncbi:hypothetical protein M3Y99_01778400 [Aphelenchoides fujianensis]|nr:hypothetical protein M3Y99_01778400 [Aphelenchoides fujianensis]
MFPPDRVAFSVSSRQQLAFPPPFSRNFAAMSAVLRTIRPPIVHSNTPLVLLLGWGGAKERQLAKYAEIYEQRGCEVVAFIAPFGRLSGRSFAAYRRHAADLWTRALADVRPERPLFVHALSMNGISVFAQTWDLLAERPDGAELKARVRGLVFDRHRPLGHRSVDLGDRLQHGDLPAGHGRGERGKAGGDAPRRLRWARFLVGDRRVFSREICFYRMLEQRDLPRRQLFLYSTVDAMIRARDVDRFAAHQRLQGVHVRQKRWPDSPHVQHFRKHPLEYTQLCSEFIDDCLSNPLQNDVENKP